MLYLQLVLHFQMMQQVKLMSGNTFLMIKVIQNLYNNTEIIIGLV